MRTAKHAEAPTRTTKGRKLKTGAATVLRAMQHRRDDGLPNRKPDAKVQRRSWLLSDYGRHKKNRAV